MDWLEELGDFGPETPPALIDRAIGRSEFAGSDFAGADFTGSDEATLYVRASLFLVRHIQAAMIPGRYSPPTDLDQAVRAGRASLAGLREDDDVYPELESAVLQVVAEALQLRDAPGDIDLAVDLMTEATGRFPAGSAEWGVALGGLADRLFARYTKHHRDADFAATEHALRTAFDAGWPDRPSMWLRLGSLYEERFRAGGDPHYHRRALEILQAGWREESGYPLLAVAYADAAANSAVEPTPGELDTAVEVLAAVDPGALPAMVRKEFHLLEMAAHFRRFNERHDPVDVEATVAAAGRLIERPETEPDLWAEARWIRATVRMDHASRTGDRMAAVDPIIADLEAALPGLTPDQRRFADAQLTRMLSERYRRTGDDRDGAAAQTYATEALDRLPEGTAEGAETRYHLACLLIGRAEAGRIEPAAADRATGLFRRVVDDPATAPKVRAAAAAQLATAIGAVAHYSGGDPSAVDEAIALTHDALRATSLDDMNRVALAMSLAQALLLRFEHRGDLADLRWCLDLLRDARDEAPDDPHRHEMTSMAAQAQIMWAEAVGGVPSGDTLAVLTGIVTSVPRDEPTRFRALRSLAGGYAMRAGQTRDADDWRLAVRYAREMLDGLPADASFTTLMRMSAGGTLILAGRALEDPGLSRTGVDLLGAALREPAGRLLRGRFLATYGVALVGLHHSAPRPGDLDHAIGALREANELAAAQPGQRGAAEIGLALASALAVAGDPAAVETGLAALRARAWQVLLQSGTQNAMTAAQRSATDAVQVARAALRFGDRRGAWLALETGRGLVLHAATVASTVPELLREADAADLAEQWSADPLDADGAGWRTAAPAMPGDARFRALGILEREVTLFDPPSVEAVGEALAEVGADALVYLLPGTPGLAVMVERDGRVDTLDLPDLTGDWAVPAAVQRAVATRELAPMRVTSAVGRTLTDVCRAAWDSAIRPLLDHWQENHRGEPHLVLVPAGALATVPWHAANGSGRWAIDEASFSYVASGRLLVEVAGRAAPPPGDVGLVIGNPDTGRDADALPEAGAEATTIFREHYARGRFCGRPSDPFVAASGPGRPEDVFAWLTGAGTPPATVLHLACHGVVRSDGPASSYLLLAGGAPVSAEELLRAAAARPAGRSLGLVSLAACTTHRAGRAYDEAVTLSTAFLVAGATTTVGSLWPVPDRETARLMVAFHGNLAGRRMPPHLALREAQRAMRDADDDTTLTHWAGFVHLGR
ncbi:CHAT domain-containing protein [Actinoplanes sp. NPDC051411]|uniref:CHAT domain-containing protein n=1 Tax=Actinoplanes sp. NPDC051411 TaxID=3155522 RepID=UPI00343F734F